jgi:hypothetical protein
MLAAPASAAITADEAKALGGPTLTQFGAEKAGNADGSIPAYTGGIDAASHPATVPAGKGAYWPDPYASDQKIVSITAQNMAQYASLLTPGTQTLLQRLSGYRVDVYPTHRPVSYPQWALDNTVKIATTAQITGTIPGDGVTGAYAGIPFPIPKTGSEVIWNNFLRYQPVFDENHFHNALMDSSGALTDLGEIDTAWINMYYDKTKTALPGNFANYYYVNQMSPEAAAGDLYLFEYPINYSVRDQTTWFYSPGLRRVRLAPEYSYDTPIASYGGALTFDEIDMFAGRMDRFDFKLAGKKEMLIPYDNYKFDVYTANQSDIVGPKFINPDFVRWEKHRVWVVDATLKAGYRHVCSRKTFYVDEDSWKILASESYDEANAIYRVMYVYSYFLYGDNPEAGYLSEGYGAYDMSKGNYFISHLHSGPNDHWTISTEMPRMSQYSPEAMASHGTR